MGQLGGVGGRVGEETSGERGGRPKEKGTQFSNHVSQKGQQGSDEEGPGCRGEE